MFANIIKGKDLSELEAKLNQFFTDVELKPEHETNNRKLKVYNVQQFVIGEVDPKAVSIINQQPVPKFSFCLLLICGYE